MRFGTRYETVILSAAATPYEIVIPSTAHTHMNLSS
jgi:hypothetical protein